jgi:very-short-patch-repair endonuclease
MKSTDAVNLLLASAGGVIVRHDHPELRGTLEWLVRTGRLVPVLPGTYARPDEAHDRTVRMRAAARRFPDGVFVGAAAARLTYWPEAPINQIEMALPDTTRDRPGFAFHRRTIPPELVLTYQGLRLTTPALTAIELATEACADSIDVALRSRRATLAGMHEVLRLTPNRPGNLSRRRLLLDSRDEPWSAAERQAHRVLRRARIADWKSNWEVTVDGYTYFIDVAFRRLRLAVEVDGRIHETNEDLFESDRRRQNALVLTGWRVLRFTWPMLRDEPEAVVATIRQALRG